MCASWHIHRAVVIPESIELIDHIDRRSRGFMFTLILCKTILVLYFGAFFGLSCHPLEFCRLQLFIFSDKVGRANQIRS